MYVVIRCVIAARDVTHTDAEELLQEKGNCIGFLSMVSVHDISYVLKSILRSWDQA